MGDTLRRDQSRVLTSGSDPSVVSSDPTPNEARSPNASVSTRAGLEVVRRQSSRRCRMELRSIGSAVATSPARSRRFSLARVGQARVIGAVRVQADPDTRTRRDGPCS